MARKKEFLEDEVLDRAMETFWEKGYGATSIDDLVTSTGLHRGSLYNAFGGKHELLQACIHRYEQVVGSKLVKLLEGEGSAKELILRFFEDFIDRVLEDPLHRGCLITNSAIELAPHDPESSEKIAGYLKRIEDAMCSVIERAQQDGEIERELDSRVLAGYMISSLQGLRVMAKVFPDRSKLSGIVRVILSVIR